MAPIDVHIRPRLQPSRAVTARRRAACLAGLSVSWKNEGAGLFSNDATVRLCVLLIAPANRTEVDLEDTTCPAGVPEPSDADTVHVVTLF